MIRIDGRSGGGQMLRTALTLSAVTGEPFEIINIRGSRPKPGLKHQHLKSVEIVKEVCSADVKGANVGSERLFFEPDEIRAGAYSIDIETAGSITLLLDTVLPITTQMNEPFELEVIGGTDVKWSPSFDYLKEVKLDILRKFGFEAELNLVKTGFYPKGGGKAVLKVEPHHMEPIVLHERGGFEKFVIHSKASKDLEEKNVAERQAKELEYLLDSENIEKIVDYMKTESTGSALTLKAVYEDSIAGFDSLGERGKSSENVAEEAHKQFKEFESHNSPVDKNMADQLIVFLALVGGDVVFNRITPHIETCLSVVEQFGKEVRIEEGRCGKVLTR